MCLLDLSNSNMTTHIQMNGIFSIAMAATLHTRLGQGSASYQDAHFQSRVRAHLKGHADGLCLENVPNASKQPRHHMIL